MCLSLKIDLHSHCAKEQAQQSSGNLGSDFELIVSYSAHLLVYSSVQSTAVAEDTHALRTPAIVQHIPPISTRGPI